MKCLFACCSIFSVLSCFAQVDENKFPAIPEKGSQIAEFIPKKWKIIDSSYGYFNQDRLKDVALVIQALDSLKIIDSCSYINEPFYPKMILILFKDINKTSYNLSSSATKLFGTCNWAIQGQDPFDKIFKQKKSIAVRFLTGGTLRSQQTFFFQYLKRKWYLVWAVNATYQQGDPEAYIVTVNLLTRSKESYTLKNNGSKSGYEKAGIDHGLLVTLENFDGTFPTPLNDLP